MPTASIFGIYVLSVSRFTPVYMSPIDPFRRLIVYPSLLRIPRLESKHSAQSDANARFKQASRTPDRQRSVLRDAVQFEIGLAPQRMPKANVIIWSGV
jgi:hypothetical protein